MPWLGRVPMIVVGVGVAWLILVALVWVGATATIVAAGLDPILHYLVGTVGVLLIVAYLVAGAVAWVLAKKLAAELGPSGTTVGQA